MFKRFLSDIRRYFGFSVVSAKSQLKSEVAGSYLNWIWWILDPLCLMLIYTFIFGYVFNAREESFSVYIFIGLTIWSFFSKTLKSAVRIVKHNKGIVSKVYFPKYILILSRIWENGFKMMVSFAIVAVMMLVMRIPLSWNVLLILPVLLILCLFTFGCSCFLLHYGVYVEDLSNIVNILLRFLMYLTGIFYNLEKRIPEFGAALNRYNPVAFLLSSARECLIYSETPDMGMLLVWFAVSVLLSAAGIRKIYKEENSYVKAI